MRIFDNNKTLAVLVLAAAVCGGCSGQDDRRTTARAEQPSMGDEGAMDHGDRTAMQGSSMHDETADPTAMQMGSASHERGMDARDMGERGATGEAALADGEADVQMRGETDMPMRGEADMPMRAEAGTPMRGEPGMAMSGEAEMDLPSGAQPAMAAETAMCPADIESLVVRVTTIPRGGALVFTAPRAGVEELRGRLQRFVAQRQPAAMPAGHTMGSSRAIEGSEMTMIEHVQSVELVEIPRGARLEFRLEDGEHVRELRTELRQGARELSNGNCPVALQMGS